MSDNSEVTTEQVAEQGVEIMSVKDAISFAETGNKPVPQVQEEAVEEEKPKEVVKETTEKPKEEIQEEVKPEVKEEVVVEQEKPTEKVAEKAKDPYEDILDDEDRAYLSFKKNNPGTNRSDYEESKVDYDKLDRKDLLRKSLREKYNITYSDAELDAYIEEKLGIPMDANESEMSVTEYVALQKETEDYINSKKEQQNKWLENTNKPENKTAEQPQEELVELENGQKMSKKEYDKIVENRNKYIKGNEEALNRVNATSFKIEVDDNGSKRELEYSYEFSKEDKNRILSISSDPVAHFNKTYTTKEGFNHDAINIDQAWSDSQLRSKMIKNMLQTARAEGFEESLKEQGNVKLGANKQLHHQETNGIKIVPLTELFNK